eukprot:Clim_evm38s108 gene=Clim_evmTU38s108
MWRLSPRHKRISAIDSGRIRQLQNSGVLHGYCEYSTGDATGVISRIRQAFSAHLDRRADKYVNTQVSTDPFFGGTSEDGSKEAADALLCQGLAALFGTGFCATMYGLWKSSNMDKWSVTLGIVQSARPKPVPVNHDMPLPDPKPDTFLEQAKEIRENAGRYLRKHRSKLSEIRSMLAQMINTIGLVDIPEDGRFRKGTEKGTDFGSAAGMHPKRLAVLRDAVDALDHHLAYTRDEASALDSFEDPDMIDLAASNHDTLQEGGIDDLLTPFESKDSVRNTEWNVNEPPAETVKRLLAAHNEWKVNRADDNWRQHNDSSSHLVPEVIYKYIDPVDGSVKTGRGIWNGQHDKKWWKRVGTPSRQVSLGMLYTPAARLMAQQLPQGTPVEVYVNPRDSSDTALLRGMDDRSKLDHEFNAIGFLIVGVLMAYHSAYLKRCSQLIKRLRYGKP